jgi:hypothetical protein
MIEMSANGALFAELDAAAAAGREFRLHVIHPAHPLPLDSELFAGRISADTLVAMGYRDAWDYLGAMRADGVAKDISCTAMTDAPEGVRVSERLGGRVGDVSMRLTVTVELSLPESGPVGPARLVGHVDHAPWGGRLPLAGGRVDLDGPAVVYRARVLVHGGWVDLEARRVLADDRGLDGWADASTVHVRASTGESGTLRLGPLDAARAVTSVEPVGAHGLANRADVLTRLGRAGLRHAFAAYGSGEGD